MNSVVFLKIANYFAVFGSLDYSKALTLYDKITGFGTIIVSHEQAEEIYMHQSVVWK